VKGRLLILVLAAAFAAARPGAASAEIALEGVHWQAGRVDGGRVAFWRDVHDFHKAPGDSDRLRARLVMKNDGPRTEEGLLLRYSLFASVLEDGDKGAGSWAVPFSVGEKRVPKIDAGKTMEVPLDPGAEIDRYLKRLERAGWKFDRVRIQVMLDPHRGMKALQIVDSVLEIGSGAAKP
jgi:hypothetical protein